MTKKCKKAIAYTVAGLAGASLLAGTLSYFTDREMADAEITTSGAEKQAVDIQANPDPSVTPDDPTKPPFEDPTPDDTSDDLTNWWTYVNSTAMANFNPGDKLTLDFSMDNVGELAVDVRETFFVSSSEPLSAAPEFRLFSSYSEDANGSNEGDEVVLEEERISDTLYKYTIAPYSLSSEDESLTENPATKAAKKYYLVFDEDSSNAFQGAGCRIDYVAEAKQHTLGGDADWVTAATAQIQVGGQNLHVVPSGNQ